MTLSGGFDKVAACLLSLSRLAARYYRHLLILINALRVFCSLCQQYTLHCAVSSFAEPPADVICIPKQPLENFTPQAIDFLHVADFLCTVMNTFPCLHAPIESEIPHTPL